MRGKRACRRGVASVVELSAVWGHALSSCAEECDECVAWGSACTAGRGGGGARP